MILYHFTCPWLFWGDDWKSGYDPETGMLSTPTRDLVPSNAQYDHDGLLAQWRIPVVWLTTSTETKPAEHPQILRFLLTVRLPSTDRRLCGYAKWWGREHFHLVPPRQLKKQVAYWWVYRSIIPAHAIVDAQLLQGERPWWEEGPSSPAGTRGGLTPMEPHPITDITIAPRQPRWPVRLDPGRTTVTAEGCPRHRTLDNWN